MAVADLTQALEVALRRREHPGGSGDRLDDDGGDRRGVVDVHDALELVGEVRALLRLAAAVRLRGKVVRRGQVVDVGKQVAVGDAVLRDAADRDAAEAHPVVRAFAADEAHARGLAVGAMVGEGDLEGGVDRLGSGIAEEDIVEVAGRELGHAVRAFEGDRVAELERRGVVERAHLRRDRIRDALAAMARVHAPQARGAVEHFAPIRRLVVHALRRGEEARVLLERDVRGERHPVRLVAGGTVADREIVHGHCQAARFAHYRIVL